MKTFLLLMSLLAWLPSARADMLGINLELSRDKSETTRVTIRAGALTQYNRDHATVTDAAAVLRGLKFAKDGKFAVVHSTGPIPPADLIPLLEAMSANHIAIYYMQLGAKAPTGMDIWNRP